MRDYHLWVCTGGDGANPLQGYTSNILSVAMIRIQIVICSLYIHILWFIYNYVAIVTMLSHINASTRQE